MSIATVQHPTDERDRCTATRPPSVNLPRHSGGTATGPAGSSRAGALLIGASAALVPWIASLWARLPAEGASPGWRLAWVTIDALEAIGLFTSGLLVRRGSRWQSIPLALTGSLLLVDAALDVTTAAPSERSRAVALLAVELPLATWCLRRVRS